MDDSTKEEREVERLINKEPAPSRKPKQRRGPKHDNRRKRMTVDDPDMSKSDKDMSLNYKSSSLLAIAARVAEDAKNPDKPRPQVPRPTPKPKSESKPKNEPKPKPEAKPPAEPKAAPKPKPPAAPAVAPEAPEELDELHDALSKASPSLSEAFEAFTTEHLLKPGSTEKKVAQWCNQQLNHLHQLSRTKFKGSAGHIISQVLSMWPREAHAFGERAGTILAIDESMGQIGLPSSFVNVFRKSHSSEENRKLVKNIIDDDRVIKEEDLQSSDFITLATLSILLGELRKNPLKLDKSRIESEVDKSTKVIYDQALQVLSLKKFVDSWKKAAEEKHFTDANDDVDDSTGDPHEFFNEAQKSLKSFVHRKNKILDVGDTLKSLKAEFKSRFGEVPSELEGMMKAASSQSSYGAEVVEAMPHKTASYHGVLKQGHPSGPTNGDHVIDRRHLGKEHYDSIIKLAQELLKEDWLAYAWEGGAKDAPVRAALDLAIHTADGSAYQSKIDAETYDMLLNRLAGWEHDTFQDTLLPMKKTASAVEAPEVQSILRVASEIRHVDPQTALEVVKGLRSMMASLPSEWTDHLAQDGLSEKDLDSLPEAKLDMKDLKEQSKKLVDAKDVGDFMSGLKGLSDTMSKSASSRIASYRPHFADEIEKLEVLEDMSDDQVKQLLEDQKNQAKELEHKADMDDIDGFLKGLDDMFGALQDAAKKVETASVRVNIATLIQIAKGSPEALNVVKPLLLLAKKKLDKKKGKKTSLKKDDKAEDKKPADKEKGKSEDKKPADKEKGKKPPFGGKKAPPFGGKKAPPFKKKASEEDITSSDTEW